MSFPSVSIGNKKYSPAAVLEAFNYGTAPLFSKLSHQWRHGHAKTLEQFYCIWDQALILDVKTCLLRESFDLRGLKSANLNDEFNCNWSYLRDFESRTMYQDARMLLEMFDDCMHFAHAEGFAFPHCYIVHGICQLINYLRDKLRQDGLMDNEVPSFDRFTDDLIRDWDNEFSIFSSVITIPKY